MALSTSSLSSSVLPIDLLLEIAACSDPVTLVRCAATCKVLRRHIADLAFHRLLRLRNHADRFVPTLLRGFFLQNGFEDPRFFDPRHPNEPSPEPFRSFLSKLASLFHFYRPDIAASRGLVALRPDSDNSGLCVFDPMTGYHHMFGRPPAINPQSFSLLTDDSSHGLYRLLAAELAPGCLKTQTFSQAVHKWEAVVETTIAPCPQDAALLHRPLVLQGDVHWLCRSSEYHFILMFSPALAAVSVTKVGGSCGEQLLLRRPEELLLVSNGGHGGRHPRILVAAGLQISLWTLLYDLSDESCWSMQVLVSPGRILRPPWSQKLELRWFGEKSGFVFLRMAGAQERSPSWYFTLELSTRRVRGVCTAAHQDVVFFPYEMDLAHWRPSFPRKLQ